jgi:hypothetical protein
VVVSPGVFARLWWFLPDVCYLAEGWIRRMCEVRRIQVTTWFGKRLKIRALMGRRPFLRKLQWLAML